MYQNIKEISSKIEKYLQEHPEVIEKAIEKWSEQLVNFDDVSLNNTKSFRFVKT